MEIDEDYHLVVELYIFVFTDANKTSVKLSFAFVSMRTI